MYYHIHSSLMCLSLGFKLREDWRYIKYAFRAKDKNSKISDEIFAKRGIRWTPISGLAGWLPSNSSPIDFMHCVFLCKCFQLSPLHSIAYKIVGMVKNLVKVILYTNGMLNVCTDGHNPLSRLEKFYRQVVWPASVGRLPPSVSQLPLPLSSFGLLSPCSGRLDKMTQILLTFPAALAVAYA